VDEVESVMHELGSAFVADLTQPGSMQAVLKEAPGARRPGVHAQTFDAAGKPAHIRGSYSIRSLEAVLFNLLSAVKSVEGIEEVLAVEVSGTPSANYVVTYSTDLPSLPVRVAFDDRGRYPGDPWVDMDRPGRDWVVDVDDAALIDEVAALPDPSVIQSAWLRLVDQVRLQDLADLAHLRSIRVGVERRKARFVDMRIPAGLRVERVHIVAERFDPRPLANTPTLTHVALAGNTAPASVAALAGLPNLAWLELAGADVADVGSIAAFPALRILSLNAQQWNELLKTAWTPERLIAAELGRTSLPEATTWLTAIRGGHRVARHRTIRGRC
jgi:hypothetical protein